MQTGALPCCALFRASYDPAMPRPLVKAARCLAGGHRAAGMHGQCISGADSSPAGGICQGADGDEHSASKGAELAAGAGEEPGGQEPGPDHQPHRCHQKREAVGRDHHQTAAGAAAAGGQHCLPAGPKGCMARHFHRRIASRLLIMMADGERLINNLDKRFPEAVLATLPARALQVPALQTNLNKLNSTVQPLVRIKPSLLQVGLACVAVPTPHYTSPCTYGRQGRRQVVVGRLGTPRPGHVQPPIWPLLTACSFAPMHSSSALKPNAGNSMLQVHCRNDLKTAPFPAAGACSAGKHLAAGEEQEQPAAAAQECVPAWPSCGCPASGLLHTGLSREVLRDSALVASFLCCACSTVVGTRRGGCSLPGLAARPRAGTACVPRRRRRRRTHTRRALPSTPTPPHPTPPRTHTHTVSRRPPMCRLYRPGRRGAGTPIRLPLAHLSHS